MQISKYQEVASHFTCMGTLCISGVSARHGFEQAVLFGWLSNITIGVCPIKISEGCPQYFQSVSNEKYQRVVQHYYQSMSNETSMRTKTKKNILFWK